MKDILKRVLDKFVRDDTPQLAAALAFYVTFSFAPLVIIFYSLAGRLSANAVDVTGDQIEIYLGTGAKDLFETVVKHSQRNNLEINSIGGLAGLFSLLLSASFIFGELRDALNRIFEIKAKPRPKSFLGSVNAFIKERLAAIGMVLSFDLLIIFSLLASSFIFGAINVDNKGLAIFLAAVFSWIFYAFAFTLMLRFVPVKHQPWSHSLKGGVLIATLFLIGKELIGIYIGKTAVGSDFGAAGSAILMLVWIYYSAIVIFFGAEITFVLNHPKATRRYGPTAGSRELFDRRED